MTPVLSGRTIVPALLAAVLTTSISSPLLAQGNAKPAATDTPSKATQDRPAAPDQTASIEIRHGDPQEIAAILSRVLQVEALPSKTSGMVVVLGSAEQIVLAQRHVEELEAAAERRQLSEVKDQQMARERVQSAADRFSLTLDFPGGTVGDYVALVHKTSGFDNVVVGSDDILKLRMPKVQVKKITGSAAIALLESLRFMSGENIVHLAVHRVEGDPDGAGIDALPVMVVDVIGEERQEHPTQTMRTDVFDLGPLMRNDQAMLKGLLEAIGVGMELNGQSGEFSMKFHQGTGLLFVKGTADDLGMVARTVSRIMGQPK